MRVLWEQGFSGLMKMFFLLQRVASLFLYYFKSYCEPKKSLFYWCSNKYESGISQKHDFFSYCNGEGGIMYKEIFHDKGGEGVKQKGILHDEGGREGPDPPPKKR